jgi:hypothetical protein
MSYSLDSLFVLMVEKIQTIKLLDRLHPDRAYCGAKKEIKLIHKVIKIKEATGKWHSTNSVLFTSTNKPNHFGPAAI